MQLSVSKCNKDMHAAVWSLFSDETQTIPSSL